MMEGYVCDVGAEWARDDSIKKRYRHPSHNRQRQAFHTRDYRPGPHRDRNSSIRASATHLTAAHQVIADQVLFRLPQKQWKQFCDALDAPPKTIPALRKVLTKPGLFHARR